MPADHSDKTNPNRKKGTGPTSEQKGYSTSEAIIELRDSLIGKSHANREQQNGPKKRKPTIIEVATLVLLFLTTAGLGVQDVILWNSDTTFKATLDNQKQSNERQLRAYVGIAPGDVEDFGINGKQTVRFVRKNFGLTPAYDVGFSTVGFAIVAPSAVMNTNSAEDCAATKYSGLITMFPSTELPWNITVKKQFSPEEIRQVKSGDRVFVYFGVVCYNDTFKKPHYTRFCWMYKGESMTTRDADGCLTHNDSN